MRLFLTGRKRGPAVSPAWPASARYSSISRCASSVHRNEPDFVPFALDPKMHHALPALHVLYAQPAELLATDAVIEQGGQDGAIAHALESIVGRRIEQLAGLGIAERRRAAFIAVGHRPLDAVHRIAGDGVLFAEIIEQRRQRREFPPDAGIGAARGTRDPCARRSHATG